MSAATADKAVKAALIGLCVYEPVALGSHGRLPTVTALCRRYPLVKVALLDILILHVELVRKAVTEAIEELEGCE